MTTLEGKEEWNGIDLERTRGNEHVTSTLVNPQTEELAKRIRGFKY